MVNPLIFAVRIPHYLFFMFSSRCFTRMICRRSWLDTVVGCFHIIKVTISCWLNYPRLHFNAGIINSVPIGYSIYFNYIKVTCITDPQTIRREYYQQRGKPLIYEHKMHPTNKRTYWKPVKQFKVHGDLLYVIRFIYTTEYSGVVRGDLKKDTMQGFRYK